MARASFPHLVPDLSPYKVTVEQGSEGASVLLEESNLFGSTALAFTPEQAREIGLQLIRSANAVCSEKEDEDAEVLEYASAR